MPASTVDSSGGPRRPRRRYGAALPASTSPRRTGTRVGPILYRLFVTIVRLLVVRAKPRRALEAEVIALRHQVAVLHHHVPRPELTKPDRAVLAGLARLLPRRVLTRFIVAPDTIDDPEPDPVPIDTIRRQPILGGLINEYRDAA